jgi:hypothetical protein
LRSPRTRNADEATDPARGERHLALARESLRELADDPRVPPAVRSTLAADFADIERMLDKLEHGHVHIAAFGRVGAGKSSLLNALLGSETFTVSPLHGETRQSAHGRWLQYESGGVFLIDTPGINEIEGEDRERIAREAALRADLILFVVEADLTATELEALRWLAACGRPMILVLNKADRYTADERERLVESLARRSDGLIESRNLVTVAARPAPEIVIAADRQGGESRAQRQPAPDVEALRVRLWDILEREGKTLAALNASLFAGTLSRQVSERIVATRRALAERIITTYCVAKGVAVALNPIPIADLAAAAMVDVALVVHLSRLHGLPLNRAEAGSLIGTILRHLTALMGTVWAVHALSAALKLGTGGLSTLVTAGAQGAVAYYGTYVVGHVAERYLALGKSWGEAGPKRVVTEILASLDRDSVLERARSDILAYLRSS